MMLNVSAPPSPDSGRRHKQQAGSALVLAIFALVLLAGMGIALHYFSQTEMQMGATDLQTKKVFYLAEAALESGRNSLIGGGVSVDLAAELTDSAGPNGVIDFDPDSLQPVYDSGGQLTGFTGYGDDVPLRPVTAFGDGFYAAFLTNDHVDGVATLADSNDRVIINGIGSGPRASMEIVQAIVEPSFVLPQVPIAGITLLGPTPFFDGGDQDCTSSDSGDDDSDSGGDDDSGSASIFINPDIIFASMRSVPGANAYGSVMFASFSDDDSDSGGGDDSDSGSDDDSDSGGGGSPDAKTFDGTDCGGTGVPNLWAPVVGAIGAAARDSARNGMGAASCSGGGDDDSDSGGGDDSDSGSDDDSDSDDGGSGGGDGVNNEYVSGTYEDGDTFADLTDGTEPTVGTAGQGPIHSDWTDCAEVKDMMEDLRLAAGYVCTTSPCTLPTTTASSVLFVDGDLTLDSSVDGLGMIAVTGTLQMDGDASWRGVMLVIGEGQFTRTGGPGDGEISGATVVADIAGPDNVYGTDDDCTGGTDGFNIASYDEADGQLGDTTYCTNHIQPASPLKSYRVEDFRQR